MNKLYHYVHCPFCIRVRLVLGFLKIPFESVVIGYDDEKTPIELTGKKMLPIFKFDENFPGPKIQNESLDIIKRLDKNNFLKIEESQDKITKIDPLLDILAKDVHNLCMPYWIWTQEFTPSAREYFRTKKELKRGPFNKLMAQKETFLNSLNINLNELENKLTPFYESDELTILDIMIASHIWGMYIFPEFQFSKKMHDYLQNIKRLCHFEYHRDYIAF